MRNIMLVVGLCISLIASIFMAYGKVFRRRETVEEQSGSTEIHNQKEKEHRMRETRFAQIGAALLILGFSVQIAANVISNHRRRDRLKPLTISIRSIIGTDS